MLTPRYLTKSRFKLATECETKLYFTKKSEYADQDIEDEFLQALAEGGYQVGELAKFYFDDQPQNNGITVESIGYEEPLEETRQKIKAGQQIIAEAAVKYDNLFIRVDIFQIDTEKKEINFYEVKAKSYGHNENFWNAEGNKLNSKWKPYLYDVAFQKYVIEQAFPKYSVTSHLMLVDKDAVTSVDGLNQQFVIDKTTDYFTIEVDPKLHRKDLGDDVLTIINTDNEVDFIWNRFDESLVFPHLSFIDYIQELAKAHKNDEKLEAPITKECKGCQFFTKPEDEAEGKKSGFKECWKKKAGLKEEDFKEALVTTLWGGKAGAVSVVQNEIDERHYRLKDVEPESYDILPTENDEEIRPKQRRAIQIHKEKTGDETPLLLKALKHEMQQWNYPLHFIDFETSAPALPFRKGQHPYEGIAFQYSHHKVYENGKIEHAGQFLLAEPGVDPNIEFIRSLKKELEKDSGTIFRYHNHENTYLVNIYFQLDEFSEDEVPDKTGLQNFIQDITHLSDKKAAANGVVPWEGIRDMVDMWDLVVRYHYSPYTQGSNSIKAVLPAVIHDSEFIQNKYSQPIYGKNKEISSLNFDNHIWIQPDKDYDPYKTLPKIFEEYDEDKLDSLVEDMEQIAQGGAAMIAYAKLQFSHVPEAQREQIKQALLKYCELDTMAMVMIWDYWREELR
jgi:hypothetical protein